MGSYTAPPIPAADVPSARSAELVFHGVEQAGPSFEARVFLNNPDADESTPQTPEAGYAGSFHVYGYGQSPPPAIAQAKAKQLDDGAPIAPIEKQLRADEEALRAAFEKSPALTVTVVSVPAEPGGTAPERPFQGVDVVFDPA
jgi:hypothetical protein